MKIALITTRTSLEENKRIATEVQALGHDFVLLDTGQFEYVVENGVLRVPGLDGSNPDLVIVRGIFNSVKANATFINHLRRQGIKVFDNNFSTHAYSINKIVDIMKLATAGVSIPDTYHLHDFDKFVLAAKKIGFPVICKLARTGKGAGVYKFDNELNLQNFLTELQDREIEPKSYMLQRFVDYEHDLRILIIGDKVFCMKRIPGEGEFRANFSLGGSVETFDLNASDRKIAFDALHAVGLDIGGVDLLIGKNGKRYILEVNHTAGFVGMELATSTNIGKIWVEYTLANAK